MGNDPRLRGVGGRADPGPAGRFRDRCRLGPLYPLARDLTPATPGGPSAAAAVVSPTPTRLSHSISWNTLERPVGAAGPIAPHRQHASAYDVALDPIRTAGRHSAGPAERRAHFYWLSTARARARGSIGEPGRQARVRDPGGPPGA